jgi:hypothetical protein
VGPEIDVPLDRGDRHRRTVRQSGHGTVGLADRNTGR